MSSRRQGRRVPPKQYTTSAASQPAPPTDAGLDARPDRLAAFNWHRNAPPTLRELVSELAGRGVRRFVLGHATGDPEVAEIAALARTVDADLLIAGGVSDAAGIRRMRDTGAAGIILGEALLSGAIDYQTAREAAA